MTARDTPSPDPVLRLLEESGLPEEPLLPDAVRRISALGEGPAPETSAELGQLMSDGGRAPRSRRSKRRITFIGGALAVSMGAGMSGVAAGTLHLPSGLGDAVDSIVRFTARDSAGRAERPAHPSADTSEVRASSGHGAAGATDGHGMVGSSGDDKPLEATAASGLAPTTSSAPSGSGTSAGAGVLPAPTPRAESSSAVSGALVVFPASPPVASRAHGPAGALPSAPAPPMPSARDSRTAAAPVGPPAPGAVPVPKARDIAEVGPDKVAPDTVEQGTVGQDNAGLNEAGPKKAGPVTAGQDTVGPVKAGRDTTGPHQKGQDETRQARKVRVNSLDVGPAADEDQALPAPPRPDISWLRAPSGPSDPEAVLDDTPTAGESDRAELFLAETFIDPAAVPSEEYQAPDPWSGDVVPEEVAVPDVPTVGVLLPPGDVPDPAIQGAPATGTPEARNGPPASR